MAEECILATIPIHQDSTLTLPTSTARCVPEDGICYSSFSRGGGQATAQFGCWPSQATMQLAWFGVPECKNEVERLVCLCLETLCNNFIPSTSEISPEGTNVQGLMVLLILLLLIMLVIVFYCLYRKQVVQPDLEHGDRAEPSYYQQGDNPSFCHHGHDTPHQYPYPPPSPHQYPYPPPSPHCSVGSPAPLLRMCSAPGRLRSPSQAAEQLVSRDTPVLRTPRTRTPGLLLQGMEGSLMRYLDRPQTSIETDKGVKKRLDLGHDGGELKGNHNLAFTISKPELKLKPPGRVTAV